MTVRVESVANQVCGSIDVRPYLMYPEDLWANGGDGEGITVAIVDTGFNLDDELKQVWAGGINLVPGEKKNNLTDYCNHGTMVAKQIHAFAPKAMIYGIKVFGDQPFTDDALAAEGIALAAEKGDLANASLGGDTDTAEMRSAVAEFEKRNKTLVVSAGNDGDADVETTEISYPSGYDWPVVVGAWDRTVWADPTFWQIPEQPARYSSSSPYVDCVALGRIPGYWMDGTSFAGPAVAGLLACWQSFCLKTGRPADDDSNWAFLLSHTRQLPGYPAKNNQTGYGVLTMRPWHEFRMLEINARTLEGWLNGKPVAWKEKPFNKNGHLMLWIREFADMMGLPTEWDAEKMISRWWH